MSFDKSSDEAEYAAVAAAAAFAITSLESDNVKQLDTNRTRTPLTKIKSKISEIADAMTELGEAIRSAGNRQSEDTENYKNFDAENAEKNEIIPGKTIIPVLSTKESPIMPKKQLSFADQLTEDPSMPSTGRTPTPTIQQSPSFDEELFENERRNRPPRKTLEKTPTFGKGLEDTKTTMPGSSTLNPNLPSQFPPPPIPPLSTYQQERDAEAWEREEMARIKQKFEKLNATILEWEDKKRMKAKHKLEMAERPPTMRATAMQVYQTAMKQIKQIADAARAELNERQRKEELEAMEKANRYRTTG